ncbi:oxidoreductase, FAD/FMN-binding family protein [Histomonas meleagridis]|uniref:oxidoreductase, FAD/FMN-binding family protein n=1 Tax=Histomonas meleagridis TaxID=135588 RepID=UPI00355A0DCC|nr:oxidoreductase, FAD/FMN-binding family protein [Histomonas meleagridis]KAH0796488.1 oxidoreductase, FAD/FMN-binding family protein [Histomonas meleagridis]
MLKSILFSPLKIRGIEIPNRFMRSATYEALSDDFGLPKPILKKEMEKLADGEVGLIVPGYVYPIKHGKANKFQCGMTNLQEAQSWKSTINYVHKKGSKIIFQVCHAGIKAKPDDIGIATPIGASGILPETRDMTNSEIEETIESFIQAALRLQSVGADGIQIHAAHGYLLSAFLSPYMNRRTDKWGGSAENRLRIVSEIATSIRKAVSSDFVISIKINGNDHIDGGVTPDLAAAYIRDLPMIDQFEISCGVNLGTCYSTRAILSKEDIARFFPKDKVELVSQRKIAKYENAHNLAAAKRIHELVPEANLALVGGLREVSDMEKIVNDGIASMVSLSRPFLREPYLVRDIRKGNVKKPSCKNCALCLAGLAVGRAKCWNWS